MFCAGVRAAGPGWPAPAPCPSPDVTSIMAQLWFLSPSNKSNTLPLATRYNIKCVGLSPDGRLAIIVDEGNCFDWGAGVGVSR